MALQIGHLMPMALQLIELLSYETEIKKKKIFLNSVT
jgi:hypothetical protein